MAFHQLIDRIFCRPPHIFGGIHQCHTRRVEFQPPQCMARRGGSVHVLHGYAWSERNVPILGGG